MPTVRLYGTASGAIVHDPDDGFFETFRGPDIDGDVMVEVNFLNPYSVSTGRWEYGFYLRGGSNLYQRVSVLSTGAWEHDYRLGPDTSATSLRSESSPDIERGASGRNQLRLVIVGQEGWFYINGKLQDKLDLGVAPFEDARLFITYERAGEETRFADFSVWEWGGSMAKLPDQSAPTPVPSPTPYVPYVPIYGAVSGIITHEIQKPSNFFELFYGPTTGEDIMMEVIFHNPPPTSEGDWNYGFLLRNAKGNVYHWLYVDSKGEWVRKLRLGEDQATLPFGNSRISNIDQTPGGKNKLRLVIIGDRAWTFINGKFQDSSDLSAIQDVDPITLVVNDLREGETRFERLHRVEVASQFAGTPGAIGTLKRSNHGSAN